MPKVCELCGCNAKAGHEQACKVINEIHIKVHDVFANYLEKQLKKNYNAIKVTAGNDNRALNNKKPDVEITDDGKKVYLDIGITFDTKRYFRIKQNHYAQMKDQNGDPLRVIPIIIGKNCTIHTKSREFLDELDIRMKSVYEEIGNLLGVYKANCTAIMYKKKVIRRDEINDHEDVTPGNQNNRFAALAMIFVFRRKIYTQQLMNTQLTQQGRRRNQMYTQTDQYRVYIIILQGKIHLMVVTYSTSVQQLLKCLKYFRFWAEKKYGRFGVTQINLLKIFLGYNNNINILFHTLCVFLPHQSPSDDVTHQIKYKQLTLSWSKLSQISKVSAMNIYLVFYSYFDIFFNNLQMNFFQQQSLLSWLNFEQLLDLGRIYELYGTLSY
ncbi:Putative_reverse transcriptase/endonuclease [Hexamita inflata]|uniref:Reverse transcriptase/endonuclease n=1 Tax=Hexamita inflata TaxID=28002 RepID=A0AA86PFY6_9EUKA|nr:Putative reverse transcriptase/endonuclease [Hexamita inflata]